LASLLTHSGLDDSLQLRRIYLELRVVFVLVLTQIRRRRSCCTNLIRTKSPVG